MQENDLRVALITGASSGIGRETATLFARSGYSVALADCDEAGGQQTLAETDALGADGAFFRCDISDEGEVTGMIKQVIARFGRIDAAFNNAGIEGLMADTHEVTIANWDRVMGVNLRGLWLCMREEISHMLNQDGGGAIVNCSSVAGLIGIPGIPAYVASKHGVVGLTKAAALEYATRQIRINAVCPGAIETPMLERYMQGSEDGRAQMVAAEPMARIGMPREVAEAVLWLCGPGSSFTTGQALAVDGGWTAK
ncbi:SDR family oxidoreductase [Aurantiacibacter marinus]|uniref:Short-chain dehydrogenase n=1 Tax=Aurantiacibacter marinus TaxID=874156 RepID=A0A0H0XSX8_9SPHN|nr:SDR family oxidoreductase [Aurantiacibacter marinus]KLI65052.1 hypothetical protein AAV99_06260 [Aurantiacibacter marinus]